MGSAVRDPDLIEASRASDTEWKKKDLLNRFKISVVYVKINYVY